MTPIQIKAAWRLMAIYVVLIAIGLVLTLSMVRPNLTNGQQPVDLSHTSLVEYHSTCIDCEGEAP
jgi:hypothetical protein